MIRNVHKTLSGLTGYNFFFKITVYFYTYIHVTINKILQLDGARFYLNNEGEIS